MNFQDISREIKNFKHLTFDKMFKKIKRIN